jgi:Flp pilus assembly protein TadG
MAFFFQGEVSRVTRKFGGIRRLRDQSGQAIVEFALVVPIFMLILLGIVDFGRYLNETLILTAAAREGARAAAVTDDNASVIQIVKDFASSIDQGSLEVSIAPPGRTSGQPVTITASNPIVFFTPMISAIFGGNTLTVRGSATMRAE